MQSTNGGLSFQATLDNSDFLSSVKEMKTALSTLTEKSVNESNRQIDAFKKLSTYVKTYLSVGLAKEFVSAMVDVRGEFQQIENAIETITGSKQAMQTLVDQWKELTLRSPFRLSEIAQSGKQLLAMGIDAQSVTKDIEMIANVASGVSAPVQDIAYLFGQIKTQGRAMTQDLNQFAGRGIPIIQSLADVLHVSEDQVKSLASQGRISFEAINEAFAKMTSSGGQFYNLIGKQADTLPGKINRLKHEIELALNEMGQDSESTLNKGIDLITDLVENWKTIVPILGEIITMYGAYKAAVIATTAIQNAQIGAQAIRGWLGLTEAIEGATVAQEGLNASQKANAIGIIVSLLAGLVYAYENLQETQVSSESIQNDLADAITKESRSIVDQTGKVNTLIETAKNENLSKQARIDALKELNRIAPQYFSNLSLENINTIKAKNAVDAYNESLILNAQIKARQSVLDANEAKRQKLQSNVQNGYTFKDGVNTILSHPFSNPTNYINQWYTDQGDQIRAIDKADKQIAADIQALQVKSEKRQKAYMSANGTSATLATGGADLLTEGTKKKTKNLKKAHEDQKKELQKWADDKQSLLSKINALDEKYSGITETESQKQKKAIDQDIQNVKDAILKYNRDTKGSKINTTAAFGRLNNIAGNAKQSVDDKEKGQTDLADLQKVLNERKTIWQNYEEWEKNVSIDSANDRYKDELSGYSSYIEELKGRLKILQETAKNDPLNDNGQRNENYYKPLEKALLSAIDSAQNQAQSKIDTFYQNLANKAQTYQEKVTAINDKYNKQSSEVADPKYKQAMEEQRRADLDALNADFLGKDKYYQQLLDLSQSFNSKELSQRIARAKKDIEVESKLTKDQKANAIAQLDQLEQLNKKYSSDGSGGGFIGMLFGQDFVERKKQIRQLQEQITSLENAQTHLKNNGIDDSASAYKDLASKIEIAKGSLDDLKSGNKSAVSVAKDASSAFALLGNVVGSLGDSFRNMGLDTLADDMDSVSEIAGAVSNIAQGFAAGGVAGAAVAGVTSIISIWGKAKQATAQAKKEVQAYFDAIKSGEISILESNYNNAIKSASYIANNADSIHDQVKETQSYITALTKQQDDLFKALQGMNYISGTHLEKKGLFGMGGKKAVNDYSSLTGKSIQDILDLLAKGQLDGTAKTTASNLKSVVDQLQQMGYTMQDLQKEWSAIWTGSSLDDITSTIAQVFEDGKGSIADFADTFEDLMKKSIISTFEQQYLEKQLNEWYDMFSADAQDGLSKSEIDSLNAMYNNIIQGGLDYMKNIADVTGINFESGSSDSTLSSSIKQNITEDTASIVAGLMRNVYDRTKDIAAYDKEMNASIKAQLTTQKQIQNNTAQNVALLTQYLPNLVTIANNTKSTSLRDSGLSL